MGPTKSIGRGMFFTVTGGLMTIAATQSPVQTNFFLGLLGVVGILIGIHGGMMVVEVTGSKVWGLFWNLFRQKKE